MPSFAKMGPFGRSAGGMRRLMLAAGAVVLAATGAVAQTSRPSFDQAGLAKQAMERHIRPLYADLVDQADMLARTLDAGCQRRDATDGQAIKLAFRALVLAWSRTEHLRFGPAIDDNRFERVLYWPDRQKIGERQVAQMLSKTDPAALVAQELAKKSVAVQGLPALETLLHGPNGGALLSDTPEARFACGYASAIAANIRTIAKDIVAEWAEGGSFAALWLSPGEQNAAYKSTTDTTIELLKAFRGGLYNMRDLKLLPALGLKRIAVRAQLAPKSRPPYELSGLALATMVANGEGVLDLYVNGGLGERFARFEPETARMTQSNLKRAIEDMRAMEPSGLAVFNERALMDRLALARDPLAYVLSEGATALMEVSGLGAMALGFTDDDGD
jgi:uncharacterized protein